MRNIWDKQCITSWTNASLLLEIRRQRKNVTVRRLLFYTCPFLLQNLVSKLKNVLSFQKKKNSSLSCGVAECFKGLFFPVFIFFSSQDFSSIIYIHIKDVLCAIPIYSLYKREILCYAACKNASGKTDKTVFRTRFSLILASSLTWKWTSGWKLTWSVNSFPDFLFLQCQIFTWPLVENSVKLFGSILQLFYKWAIKAVERVSF